MTEFFVASPTTIYGMFISLHISCKQVVSLFNPSLSSTTTFPTSIDLRVVLVKIVLDSIANENWVQTEHI